jgi:hypothetical protein
MIFMKIDYGPVQSQRLLFDGQRLLENQKLRDYDMKPNDIVDVVLQATGD